MSVLEEVIYGLWKIPRGIEKNVLGETGNLAALCRNGIHSSDSRVESPILTS